MKKFAVLLSLVAVLLAPCLGQVCDDYNSYPSKVWSQPAGYVQHSGAGGHALTQMDLFGECEYSSNSAQYCAINAQSYENDAHVTESGALTSLVDYHNIVATAQGGAAASTGPQIATQVTGAVAADSCVIGLGCGITITFSASASGVGVSASFPPTNLSYTYQYPFQSTCGAMLDPTYNSHCTGSPGFVCAVDGGDGGSGDPICSDNQYTCNSEAECELPPSQYVCDEGEYGSPSCGPSGWYCYTGDSPIIIDADGTGFHLTNFQGGVHFDITGDGKPQQISWTAAGSTNGWLALPHDGKVTSGKQLFGNFTPQPPSDNPNGFLALAVYDQPENGGNADGVIDWHDAVWPNLRIWIDKNHDGIAQPDELFTLPSLGINSLAVAYVNSKYVDQFGNQFRDKGRLNPDGVPPTDHVDRTIYDVFLLSGQSGTQDARKPAAFDKTITATEHALN
jgi:hypothetical protein